MDEKNGEKKYISLYICLAKVTDKQIAVKREGRKTKKAIRKLRSFSGSKSGFYLGLDGSDATNTCRRGQYLINQ